MKNSIQSFVAYFFLTLVIALTNPIQAMEKSENESHVDVKGLPLADVLIVLYNNATGTGVNEAAQTYLKTVKFGLTRNEAQKLIGTDIDNLNGRKMALIPDVLDVRLGCKAYNDNHGPGRAQGAVAKLRALLDKKKNPTEDDLRQHCYFPVLETVMAQASSFYKENKDKMPIPELIAKTDDLQSSLKKDADFVGTMISQAQTKEELERAYAFSLALANSGNRGDGSQNRFNVFGDFLGKQPQNTSKEPKPAPQKPQESTAKNTPAKKQTHTDSWAKGMFSSPKKSPEDHNK